MLPIVLALALLLGLYVGAYYASVDTMPIVGDLSVWNMPHYSRIVPSTVRNRHAWNDRLKMLFEPIHWLDRRIRPQVWDP